MASLHLPAELKGLVVYELHALSEATDNLSSISLVWKEAWHNIRGIRFEKIEFLGPSTIVIRLQNFLSLLEGSPDIALHVKEIKIGSTDPNSTPPVKQWDDAACVGRNLTTLLSVTSRVERFEIKGISHSFIDAVLKSEMPEFLSIRGALRSSSIKSLYLDQHAFAYPNRCMSFLRLFPELDEVNIEWEHLPRRRIIQSLWKQNLPPDPRIANLTVPCQGFDLMEAIGKASLFPNVQGFFLDAGYEGRAVNFLPFLRQLLPQWHATLVELVIPDFQPRYGVL